MTIDISAGRFGPVSLAAQAVQSVRRATDRDHIGSIFSRAWESALAAFMKASDRAIVPGGQRVLYDVRMVKEELRVQAICIKDIDIDDSDGPIDPELRQSKLDMVLAEGDHPFYKSQHMEMDLRTVDGDPRARIEIVGAQHLTSRDNDTIQ